MLILLIGWLICVAASDLRRRRVPNALLVAGAAAAVLALMCDAQPFSLGGSAALVGALAGLVGFLAFYALHLMGAADVKFAAALGLWIGPWPLLWVWMGASLVASAHALVLMSWRFRTGLPRTRKREIPYAAHMAAVTMGWLAWQHHVS